MYSDMSSRTIACSSSNRNSASARANSVFPTPVGPSVAQLRRRAKLAFALRAIRLHAGLLHLLLDLADLLDGVLLGLPLHRERIGLLAQLDELPLDFLQSLLRLCILVPSDAFPLDLELADPAHALIQRRGHAVDLHT